MEIKEAIDIVSYKMGLKLEAEALNDSILDPQVVQGAINDKNAGTEKKVDLKQYMAATKLVKQHRLQVYKEENEAYLESNSNNADIQTTESGLQYKVIKQTEGERPFVDQSVTVHYHGTLIDGTVFDSSRDRDKTASFNVEKIIAGWKEGITLMTTGSRFQFFIPQDLAYGDRGVDRGLSHNIPPYSTLIFEVELFEIN